MTRLRTGSASREQGDPGGKRAASVVAYRSRPWTGLAVLVIALSTFGAATASAAPVTVEFINALAAPGEQTFTVPAGVTSWSSADGC